MASSIKLPEEAEAHRQEQRGQPLDIEQAPEGNLHQGASFFYRRIHRRTRPAGIRGSASFFCLGFIFFSLFLCFVCGPLFPLKKTMELAMIPALESSSAARPTAISRSFDDEQG